MADPGRVPILLFCCRRSFGKIDTLQSFNLQNSQAAPRELLVCEYHHDREARELVTSPQLVVFHHRSTCGTVSRQQLLWVCQNFRLFSKEYFQHETDIAM